MKNIISFFILVAFVTTTLVTTSCQNSQEDIDRESIAVLKADLTKDNDFIRLSKIEKDFREKTAINYYNCFKRDRDFINANLSKLDDKTQQKAIYEKSGMVHVDEYIAFMDEQLALVKTLTTRYPLLKKDDFKVMGQVFTELMEKPKFNIDKMTKTN
jgi:hypothetical protein